MSLYGVYSPRDNQLL